MPTPEIPRSSTKLEANPDSTSTVKQLVPRRAFLSAPRRLLLGLLFCLFQAVFLAAWLSPWRYGGFKTGETTVSGDSWVAGNETVSRGNVPFLLSVPQKDVGDLGRGDEALLEGRYDAAIAAYQPLSGGSGPQADAAKYRLALCYEEQGRGDLAIALYREVASRNTASRIVGAAQLGQARVWVRLQKPAEAKRLLCDLVLRSGELAGHDQRLQADARYLLAMALSAEIFRPEQPGAFNDSVAVHKVVDWSIDQLLDWVAATKEEPDQPPAPEIGFQIQRVGPGADEVRVRGSIRQAVVFHVIESLAKQSGLRVEWTPEAKHETVARTATVVLDTVPLPDVLRALTTPLGLVWQVEGQCLRIGSEEEAPQKALAAYRVETAKRALREAVVTYPDHPLCPLALLEQANLEVAAGNLKQAAAGYERLIRGQLRSPVLTEAYYNLGIVQQRLDEVTAARIAFYQVVDRAPGTNLAPLAYLKIGRLYLDQGDFEHAISPLRRAVASGVGTPTQPAAAVTLAAAYLLTSNPRAANATLVEVRDLVGQEPFRQSAAFLDTLAHYRTATDRKQAQREASGLLAALLAAQCNTLFGPATLFLLGQAYGELGLSDRMATCFEKALPQAKGALAAEISCLLAEGFNTSGKRAAAVKLLESLSSNENGLWSSRARLRLAEMALQDSRPQECLKYCTQIKTDQNREQTAMMLKLMGRAYDLMGDRSRAARCFSGLLPEP